MTDKEISIAPMLDWTDRHFRFFLRHITRHALMYTEMIAQQAIIRGDRKKLLDFDASEQPLALQIGGSQPNAMAECAKIATDFAYSEININAGCPSSKVQAGAFGACLMQTPAVVAQCVEAMKTCTSLPISVKTRIALAKDESDDGYQDLCHFVNTVAEAGCQKFIIHARKARLHGLTPKENRQKMALNYPLVYRLKQDLPHLTIIINGNIATLPDIATHLHHTDGVMIGRAAYGNPYFLSDIDRLYYHDNHPILTRTEIIEQMLPYLEKYKGKILSISRHLMGLYHGQPHAKLWKQTVLQNDIEQIKAFVKL